MNQVFQLFADGIPNQLEEVLTLNLGPDEHLPTVERESQHQIGPGSTYLIP
jgi:hypothetical protein